VSPRVSARRERVFPADDGGGPNRRRWRRPAGPRTGADCHLRNVPSAEVPVGKSHGRGHGAPPSVLADGQVHDTASLLTPRLPTRTVTRVTVRVTRVTVPVTRVTVR